MRGVSRVVAFVKEEHALHVHNLEYIERVENDTKAWLALVRGLGGVGFFRERAANGVN